MNCASIALKSYVALFDLVMKLTTLRLDLLCKLLFYLAFRLGNTCGKSQGLRYYELQFAVVGRT
jgi:hypothetical protein